ncbi:MAG: hypothetical protein WD468_12730 [Pirellulales bacterium]
MRTIRALTIAALVISVVPLFAQESKPTEPREQPGDRENPQQGDCWTKALEDRAQRGTLHDAFQNVRGDSGKWNDEPILQHAPPIGQKPAKMPLDDWADQLLKRDFQLTSNDDNWLLLRTRQLDDNDRVWVQRIERRGKQFTVVLTEAIWQGRYSKTFTYYSALGVNLGKLAPGKYEAKWIIKPFVFKKFEGDGRPNDNWPKDERPADQKPTELRITFDVVAKASSNDQPDLSGLPSAN